MRRLWLLLLLLILISNSGATAMAARDERNVKVALRAVGHLLMLQSGDSVSRVLAVEKKGDSYVVNFEAPFSFDPGQVALVTDSIVRQAQLARSYLVEMRECRSGQVVHSYKISPLQKPDAIACGGRVQPSGCYRMLFTILDPPPVSASEDAGGRIRATAANGLLLLAIVILVLLYRYNNRKKPVAEESSSHILALGKYQFDTRQLTLTLDNESTELSSKESDLLLLLYNSANETVERETILNSVWGDEGEYVGRTLDVFISKLRKKLEGDPDIRILNVRGVGYRLIISSQYQ